MADRTGRLVLAAAALSTLAACDADGLRNHGCPIDYHGSWSLFSLSLEHTEPRVCPVFLDQPKVLETGATIVDGGGRNVNEAFLLVRNANGEPKTTGRTVIFGYDPYDRWIAPIYEDYAAGTAGPLLPDLALFDVYADKILLADADMRITYSNAVIAPIDGPVYTFPDQAYTWTAHVSHGVPPYTYRWYNDWDQISTSQSVTLTGAEMLLRVDITDARGHAVSTDIAVDARNCSGSEAEC